MMNDKFLIHLSYWKKTQNGAPILEQLMTILWQEYEWTFTMGIR